MALVARRQSRKNRKTKRRGLWEKALKRPRDHRFWEMFHHLSFPSNRGVLRVFFLAGPLLFGCWMAPIKLMYENGVVWQPFFVALASL